MLSKSGIGKVTTAAILAELYDLDRLRELRYSESKHEIEEQHKNRKKYLSCLDQGSHSPVAVIAVFF
jgi:hypothetical protein